MSKQDTNINIRISSALFDEFKKAAAENGLTPSSALRMIITAYVKNGGKV